MGNWQIVANVAGVTPFEPGFKRIPEGAYRVQIVDSDQKAPKDPTGKPSIQFECKIIEDGDMKGVTTRVFMGTDFTKDGNKKHMRALLLAIGANAQALDAGDLNLNADMFNGKQAYIFVEAPEGTYVDKKTGETKESTQGNRNFVAADYYAKWKSEHPAGAKPAAAAAPAGAVNGAASVAGLAAAQGAPAPAAGFGGAGLFAK